VLKHYNALVLANCEDILAAARELQTSVQTFVTQPSADGLQVARKAWITARENDGQSEAFRFYGGPIVDAEGPEGRLNAWPMDEAYVDYVKGKPTAGLINNRKLAITKASLSRNNGRGGDENITTGWHAIEFCCGARTSIPMGRATIRLKTMSTTNSPMPTAAASI